MAAWRLTCFMFAAFWAFSTQAQLVVRDDDLPRVANPADQVPYPSGAGNCNNTIADAGARAVLRAIDSCPETFYDSREAYLGYARQAILGLTVPGATEAAGALVLEKAAENAFFCITDALIDDSGANNSDKVFLKALLAEVKENIDRADLASKMLTLRRALAERGAAAYLNDGELQTFVKTLDVTLQERHEGLGAEGKLTAAGRARYDTPEARANDATSRARALGRECRYGEAETALASAQQLNLAYLGDLRAEVSKTKHLRYCIERDARLQQRNALDPVSPFLRHSLESADADVAEAERRDKEETQFIGELAELQQSLHARRNDVDAIRKRATRQIETARQAAAECDWARADSALSTVNTETLECALQLDAERRARDELAAQVGQAKQQIDAFGPEYARLIEAPFAQVDSCGIFSVYADTLEQVQGQCRVLMDVESRVAALRNRGRACGDFKAAALVQGSVAPSGSLVGTVTLAPSTLDNGYANSYTRVTFENTRATWERVDTHQRRAKIEWNYNNVPGSLSPGQAVTITVTGGVVEESSPGIADGIVLSGVVAIWGDITLKTAQQADRGHPSGLYEFTVNANAQTVEIHLGGAPAGTGSIWKYARPANARQ